jgi:hypothetical protein
MEDAEVKAITTLNEVLSSIDDSEIRQRVLRWANDKFGFVPVYQQPDYPSTAARPALSVLGGEEKEIAGIARLTSEGELRLTVRDLKAGSANDAALRLAHVAIRAYQQLSGQKTVSSKNVIVPLLKNWRIYDGNTRAVLARHKGIIRIGDELDLDIHAQNDADRYMRDILDEGVEGKWKPGSNKKAK